MFKEELAKAAAEYGISLSDTQMEQYNRYFELLVEWNEKINLTAITEPKEVAIKHMIDSKSCCHWSQCHKQLSITTAHPYITIK